jgi:hypothetical protein
LKDSKLDDDIVHVNLRNFSSLNQEDNNKNAQDLYNEI